MDATTLPVTVGVLGAADVVRRKILPALFATPALSVAALASRARERAAALAAAAGVDLRLCEYAELLEDETIELIYLALPNHLHEEWTLRALERGKHVVCEKPLALDLAAVRRMVAAATAHGRLLYENVMFLHHPLHTQVREMLVRGEIGTLRELRCIFTIPRPALGNYRLDPACGGGAQHDLARYPLAAADFFFAGELSSFRGVSRWQDGLNLALHASGRSTAGEILTCSIAFGQAYESRYELSGTSGTLRVERAFTTPDDYVPQIVVRRGGEEIVWTLPPADHFRLMFEHVAGLIRRGGDFSAPQQRSLRLALLAEALERGCRDDD